MAVKDVVKTHRSWEDYLGLGLAVAVGLSPWFREEPLPRAAYVNASVIGVALLLLAQFELIRSGRWEEIAELACGLWLIASPFMLGYAHGNQLRFWHWMLGGAVAALAAYEYWQGGTTESGDDVVR